MKKNKKLYKVILKPTKDPLFISGRLVSKGKSPAVIFGYKEGMFTAMELMQVNREKNKFSFDEIKKVISLGYADVILSEAECIEPVAFKEEPKEEPKEESKEEPKEESGERITEESEEEVEGKYSLEELKRKVRKELIVIAEEEFGLKITSKMKVGEIEQLILDEQEK